jgi:hypothetical protein
MKSDLFKNQTQNISSNSQLSKPAIDYIISYEVTSPNVYNKKYTSPIRPDGKSGITIGIGTDLGYTT